MCAYERETETARARARESMGSDEASEPQFGAELRFPPETTRALAHTHARAHMHTQSHTCTFTRDTLHARAETRTPQNRVHAIGAVEKDLGWQRAQTSEISMRHADAMLKGSCRLAPIPLSTAISILAPRWRMISVLILFGLPSLLLSSFASRASAGAFLRAWRQQSVPAHNQAWL